MVPKLLRSERHTVEVAETGEDAKSRMATCEYDLILLDWNLPQISGIDLCRWFRSSGGQTPILFLTGKSQFIDKEMGLDAGGDDYVTKPFDARELFARIRALLRRPPLTHETALRAGHVQMDTTQHEVHKNGTLIKLAPREYALLEFLLRHPNQVFSAERLLERVWDADTEASPETVRQSMARLRSAIADEKATPLIRTIHGVGYRLEAAHSPE